MQFIDINETQPANNTLPSVAMRFGGVYIEEEVPGYQTLNVTGREVISQTIHTIGSGDTRHGEAVSHSTLPARELRVQYKLKAPDNKTFQERFRALNAILHASTDNARYYTANGELNVSPSDGVTADRLLPGIGEGDKIVQFRDELNIFYAGQLTEMGEIAPDRNEVIGEFTIYCQTPFKYGADLMHEEDFAVTVWYDHTGTRPVTPQYITVTSESFYDIDTDSYNMNLAGRTLTITNDTTGRKIVLHIPEDLELIVTGGPSVDHDKTGLVINFAKGEILHSKINRAYGSGPLNETYEPLTGDNLMRHLDYTVSDYYNFKVAPRDRVSIRVSAPEAGTTGRVIGNITGRPEFL